MSHLLEAWKRSSFDRHFILSRRLPASSIPGAFSRLAAIVLTLGCGVGIAHAQEPHLGIAVSATTLGIGLHAAVPVSDHVNLRAGVKLFGLTHDFDSDGITLAATLKMRSIDAFSLGVTVWPGVVTSTYVPATFGTNSE